MPKVGQAFHNTSENEVDCDGHLEHSTLGLVVSGGRRDSRQKVLWVRDEVPDHAECYAAKDQDEV